MHSVRADLWGISRGGDKWGFTGAVSKCFARSRIAAFRKP